MIRKKGIHKKFYKIKRDVECEISMLHRVTHKESDCKDDLKLLKYDDFQVELNLWS